MTALIRSYGWVTVTGKYRVRHKTSCFFKQLKCYITPFRETLESKVGRVLENSGNSLYDGH